MSAVRPPNVEQPHDGFRKHSCTLCQQRKVRCDRQEPCINCTKAQVECIFREPAPVQRRKRKRPDIDAHATIARYEGILKSLGVDVDALGGEDTHSNTSEKPVQVTRVDTVSVVRAATREASKSSERGAGSAFANTGKLIVRGGRSRYFEK